MVYSQQLQGLRVRLTKARASGLAIRNHCTLVQFIYPKLTDKDSFRPK